MIRDELEANHHSRVNPFAETFDRVRSLFNRNENLYDSRGPREDLSLIICAFFVFSFVIINTIIVVNTLYKVFCCSRSSCLSCSLLKTQCRFFLHGFGVSALISIDTFYLCET